MPSTLKEWIAPTLLLALLVAPGAGERTAYAMDRDTKAVLIASGYGLVGGTALGLISLPLTGNVRSVFLGSSIGLYLGIAVGFYFVLHRDDPGNPLRAEEIGEGPTKFTALSPTRVEPQPVLDVRIPVARF